MKTLKFSIAALICILLTFTQCSQSRTRKDLPLATKSTSPKRLLLLVFDQMRPDFIERFDMKNFKRLRQEGVSFPNAIVGHMASVTVVSHPVITTGLLPKHLPWQDEILKDVGGKLGKKGAFYSTLDFSESQFRKLLAPTEEVSLIPRIKKKFIHLENDGKKDLPREGTVYTIGQKMYAAMGFGAPDTSPIITLGPKLEDPALKGWRPPSGFLVPSYFLQPFGGRFYLDSNPTYGSENTLYPFDGNRFTPGKDKDHLGGDAWVADGLIEIMEQDPKWTAIFATFGSIDKVLHMLAEHDTPTNEKWAVEAQLTLKDTLQRADTALGVILKNLEEKNILEETAIVITADHGGQPNTSFHGIPEIGQGLAYLFYGKTENSHTSNVPLALKPLIQTGKIEALVHDSALRIWTQPLSRIAQAKLATQVQSLPGIAEIYTLQQTGKTYHYIRTHRSPDLKGRALEWANKNNQDLVESFATAGSPEIVALLLDNHGYGLRGDHGGTQEMVQKIPLIIRSPNIKTERRGSTLENQARLVDINPFVTRLLRLKQAEGLDGNSQIIESLLND